GEAVYGADSNSGDFTLENTATLLTTGSGNKINASGNVTLAGTLAFDLTGITANSNDAALTLNGTIATAAPEIDIVETVTNGKYILIDSTNALTDLTKPTTFTYHGETVGETRAQTINIDTSTSKQLVLNVDTQNYDVTWTGSVDGVWNIKEKNWNGTDTTGDTITQFLHGDNVTFSTSSQKDVEVNSGGVNVVAMTVDEDGYTFSDGEIKGTSLNLNSVTTSETIFKNEIDFNNGITVAQNNTLTFDYNSNEVTNTNTFSGDGTLKKDGTEKLILSADNALTGNLNVNVSDGELELTGSNNFSGNVEITSTLTVNSTDNSTFSGTITGTGNLEKQNTGTLTLTGNSNGVTGLFIQSGGTVNLQNVWGGSYTQSNNSATLNLSDNSKIGGDANLSGIVDIRNGKLDVGGDLDLKSGSVLKMNIAEDKIVADSVNIDGAIEIDLSTVPNGRTENIIVSKTGTLNTSQLDSHFTQSNKLLVSFQPFYSNNDKTMGLTTTSQTAEQYTTQNNFRKNQIAIAALLDGSAPTQQILLSLDTQKQLEGLLTSLLAPELAAEAQELPLNHPYFRVFNHVNNLQFNNLRNTNSSTTFRGQSTCLPVCCTTQGNYEFWFEGYYQGGETHSDGNALSYKTSRGGMMVGIDQYFGDGLLTGLIFGYGNPRVYNSVGKIEADDYTFGAYSRLKIFGIYANAFLGYGSQNYQLRQNQINPNQHTNYSGDSFYASLELFKPINLRNDLSVSPLVAIDFQKAWSDGFNVNVTNIYFDNMPLTVKKGDIDQTILRVGVNSNYKNWRTRLQYGYQVAGDHYGISRTSIIGGDGNRILTGVNLGRHTFNAGLGGDFQIDNRTKLFADYDLDLGKHATSHTGQFGFVRYF
ncbi:MAG: autotransporter domain-containing protein, partial [Planctomycetaceae bacterium]|nr:autotransporter domain-containing protein [Planctomycetaceae bacterium]